MTTTRTLTLFLALALSGLVLLALSVPIARASDPVVVRVTTAGTETWPCGDQADWSNQCALQTALSNTVAGGELWVAAGIYMPTMGVTRTVTFHLRDAIALYGGFAGGETLRSQRDLAHVTVLSGDIGVPGDASDNAFHVVTGSGVTNTAVLDGFTVRGGNANGPEFGSAGGGMFNDGGSPTVANVSFINNTATYGAGMYNWNYSSPTVANVIFANNDANEGAGMYNQSSNPTLTNVTFSGNWARWYGGGLYNEHSSPTLSNVTLSYNVVSPNPGASAYGGGMYNEQSNPLLTNVTLSGNRAFIFTGKGWGVGCCGGMYNDMSDPIVRNTIFWGNTSLDGAQIHGNSSITSLSYSVVQGGYAGGTHIITGDPRLGILGYWGGTTQTIPLLPGSSAIDAGNDVDCPATDQRGFSRPQGAHCDIGAYESQGFTLINLLLIAR